MGVVIVAIITTMTALMTTTASLSCLQSARGARCTVVPILVTRGAHLPPDGKGGGRHRASVVLPDALQSPQIQLRELVLPLPPEFGLSHLQVLLEHHPRHPYGAFPNTVSHQP